MNQNTFQFIQTFWLLTLPESSINVWGYHLKPAVLLIFFEPKLGIFYHQSKNQSSATIKIYPSLKG